MRELYSQQVSYCGVFDQMCFFLSFSYKKGYINILYYKKAKVLHLRCSFNNPSPCTQHVDIQEGRRKKEESKAETHLLFSGSLERHPVGTAKKKTEIRSMRSKLTNIKVNEGSYMSLYQMNDILQSIQYINILLKNGVSHLNAIITQSLRTSF